MKEPGTEGADFAQQEFGTGSWCTFVGRKNLGCGWKRGTLISWGSEDDMSHLYGCAREAKRSVKLKSSDTFPSLALVHTVIDNITDFSH